MDFPALISASHFSSIAMPAPPSEKSSSICLSQALASRSFSQATSEVLSPSGSSAIACLMPSSVIPVAYFVPLRNANGFEKPISIVQVIDGAPTRFVVCGFGGNNLGRPSSGYQSLLPDAPWVTDEPESRWG